MKEAHGKAQILVKYFQKNSDKADAQFKQMTTSFYVIMEEFQKVHKMSSELKLKESSKKDPATKKTTTESEKASKGRSTFPLDIIMLCRHADRLFLRGDPDRYQDG